MPGGKRSHRQRGHQGAAADRPATTYEPPLAGDEQHYQEYDQSDNGVGYYDLDQRASEEPELGYDGGVDEYHQALRDEYGQPFPQQQQQSPYLYGAEHWYYRSNEQGQFATPSLDEPTPDLATAQHTEEYYSHGQYTNSDLEQYYDDETHNEYADGQEPFSTYTNHVGNARLPSDKANVKGSYLASLAHDNGFIDDQYDDQYEYAPDGEEELPAGGEQYDGQAEWRGNDHYFPAEQDLREEGLEPDLGEYVDEEEYTAALAADRGEERSLPNGRPHLARVFQPRSSVEDFYQDEAYPDDQDAFTSYNDQHLDQPPAHDSYSQYYNDQTADDYPIETPPPAEPQAQRAVLPASSPPHEAPKSDSSEDLQKYWDLANEPIDSDPLEPPNAEPVKPAPQAGRPQSQAHVERPIALTKPPLPDSNANDFSRPKTMERHATKAPKTRTHAQPVKSTKAPARLANKALGMTALRELVMIPEARADPRNQEREIGTGEDCQAVFDFFLDPNVKQSPQQPQSKKATSQAVPSQATALPRPGPSKMVKTTSKASATSTSSNNRQDPLRNPEWYTLASSASPSEDYVQPLPILVGDRVNQLRPLYRALGSHDLELIESDIQAQGVDIALSPATGIILRTLDNIAQGHVQLLNDVRRAAFFFQRVIIVFEVVSYRDIDKDPEGQIERSPPSQAVVTALGTFRRALAVSIIPDQNQVVGTAEVVFASQGAEEVAKVLRHLAEQDELKISERCQSEAREVWQGKNWLRKEVNAHEEAALDGAGFNLYSIHFLVTGFGSFEMFADQVSPAERSKLAGPVVGQDIIERFNKAYGRKKRKKELLTSAASSSDTVRRDQDQVGAL